MFDKPLNVFSISFRNLNTALWTYYEYDASDAWNLPQMKLVADVTIREGEAVAPNRTFVKTWRVRNSGKQNNSVDKYHIDHSFKVI